jgi:hypothetical protein
MNYGNHTVDLTASMRLFAAYAGHRESQYKLLLRPEHAHNDLAVAVQEDKRGMPPDA